MVYSTLLDINRAYPIHCPYPFAESVELGSYYATGASRCNVELGSYHATGASRYNVCKEVLEAKQAEPRQYKSRYKSTGLAMSAVRIEKVYPRRY
jgi:hypothetical protein